MINKEYFGEDIKKQVKEIFSSNKSLPSASLQHFLEDKTYRVILKEIKKANFTIANDPMRKVFAWMPPTKTLRKFLESDKVLDYLSSLIGKRVYGVEGEVWCFRWRNYTLLHDDERQKSGYDVVIDFTEDWGQAAGGGVVYVDGTGNSHLLPVSERTLTVTRRKPGVQRFVQYVNHLAGKRARVLFMGRLQTRKPPRKRS